MGGALSVTSPTVRDLVRTIQHEVRTTELAPSRAAELLVQLTALIGNCNDEIRTADSDYAEILLVALESSEKVNRARIRAETTPAYRRKREARDTKELVIELVRSLKYLLRCVEEEMRLAR